MYYFLFNLQRLWSYAKYSKCVSQSILVQTKRTSLKTKTFPRKPCESSWQKLFRIFCQQNVLCAPAYRNVLGKCPRPLLMSTHFATHCYECSPFFLISVLRPYTYKGHIFYFEEEYQKWKVQQVTSKHTKYI